MNSTPNATATTINVLNDVIAVNLAFSIWSGRKMLEENDLSINGKMPPKEIINLGSKHTTDPAALKPFHKLKRRAERACMRYGIPFLGGYAVPKPRAEELAIDLNKIMSDFEIERVSYLAQHETLQQEWINTYPDYAEILKKALTPVDYVSQRITANYSMFQIMSAESAIGFDVGLSNQIDSLGMTLDDDILKTSMKLLESLSSAIAPNRTNVNTLSALRQKVEGLAFLDSRFNILTKEILKVEQVMPVSGKLNPQEVNQLSGLLYRMSDPIKLDALMKNISDNSVAANTIVPNAHSITDSMSSIDDIADMLTGNFDLGISADNHVTNLDSAEDMISDFEDVTPVLNEQVDPAAKSMFF